MLKSLFSFLIIFIFSFNAFATDYFWVGGSGNWTDYGNHWAKAAGGNVFHTQVPGPLDNIYFDNTSLSGRTIINLDQTIESCKDISVSITTDTLLFTSTAANPKLSIYGSTSLSPRFKIASNIKLYFEASSGSQTFNQNRAILPCSLVFNNSGSWQVLDSIDVYYIEILKGTFNASSKKIRADYFIKTEPLATVNITNSTFYSYSIKIKNGSDVLSSINIYAQSRDTRVINYPFTNPDISIIGDAFSIDSIFSVNNYSLSLSSNAHIKYMRLKNSTSFNCSTSGVIDRIDATDLSNIAANGNGQSIGILNVTNLKGLYIFADALDINLLNFISNNDCNNLLQIVANADNQLHKLNIHNNTAQTLNYCSVSNIDASAFPLKVSNAVDGGNNTGVTFLSYAGQGTLYRIGDGVWSDITKWSLTSNGPPANCQPTKYTNVVFDAFSFTKPVNYISFGNAAECNDITVSGITSSLTFERDLKCYGDLLFSSPVNYQSISNIYMCATAGTHKIKLMGDYDPDNGLLVLRVIGTATYNFLSDIVCGELILENAKIYTNAFNINTYSTTLTSGNFYGSTSSITTQNFYNRLGSDNDFQSTRIICSTDFEHAVFAPFKYGTIITTGAFTGSGFPCEIKHLKISGTCRIINNPITCDSLSLYKGTLLQLDNTNLIFNLFYNPGNILDCGRYTNLKLFKSFFKSARDITFDQFILENVDASVSAFTYKAINSIDALNNTDVQFTQSPLQKTFYWINGAGNWSDLNHWSYTSGGSAANCIPSRIDNVIFDANALTAGTINSISIDGFFECNNFILSNTPKVAFSKGLNVFGSFSADSNAHFEYIYFLGNTAATVDTKKSQIDYVTINKTQSTTFISDVKTNEMHTVSGTLRFINTSVNADLFDAEFNNTDSLLMRNSKIHSGFRFNVNCKNGLADCSSGTIEISIRMGSDPNFRLISDSIPIRLGKIIMNYDTLEQLRRNPTDGIVLMLSNTILDSLKLESTLEVITELQLYNTKINTLQAYNNNLILSKAYTFDMNADPGRTDLQPANINNISNAQLESYTTGIANMSFDHLKIYPGSTLQIYPDDTLYIHKTLDVTGAPSYPIQISSPTNGSQGYIQNNGSVFGEYLFIQDNYVLNNPGYAGYYSSDVSNNMGWNFGVLYDTILCTFNRTPCESESIQLNVLSDQTLTNTIWSGPKGFTSANTSPTLSNLSVANNGIYTFTSAQGKCMVDISVFKNTPNKIIDDLNNTGVLSVEDYTSTPIWYFNNTVLDNETGSSIAPSQTGYYKAVTTSNRGCKYVSDSIYYLAPSDPLFQPTLIDIQTNSQNDIAISWTNVEREAGYNIYATTPGNSTFIFVDRENEDVLSSTFYNMYPPGDYCYYVKAYSASGAESLPSNTLCVNIPNTTAVKPQLTYIGLNTDNNIEISWIDISGESHYTIFIQRTTNQTVDNITGSAEQDATSFVVPNTGAGQYCVYIQANLINSNDISLPSDPLCIDISGPVSTGIRSSKISTATVYPNPTTGSVSISPSSKNTMYNLSIETLQGEKVFIKENQIGTIQIVLNLKQGVYLVKLHSDSFTFCEKLIVTQ